MGIQCDRCVFPSRLARRQGRRIRQTGQCRRKKKTYLAVLEFARYRMRFQRGRSQMSSHVLYLTTLPYAHYQDR